VNLSVDQIFDKTNSTNIKLDDTDIVMNSTNFLVNGNNISNQISTVENKTQNITVANPNVTSVAGHLFVPTVTIGNTLNLGSNSINVEDSIDTFNTKTQNIAAVAGVTTVAGTVDATSYEENGVSGLLFKNDKTHTLYTGLDAGLSQTTGARNLYIGDNSGRDNQVGSDNFGLGRESLRKNLTNNNIGIGRSAMQNNKTGTLNVAIGSFSQNGSGTINNSSYNTSIGYATLAAIADGADGNTVMGAQAGNDLTTASNNALFGRTAGNKITTGNNNSIFGAQAETDDNPTQSVAIGAFTNVGSFTNAIAIGYAASCFSDNQVVIGNSAIAQTILKGTVNCQDLEVVTIDATTATFDTITAPTANFTTSMTTPTAMIDGASLSVANNTLIATINNTQYPIAGENVIKKVDLSTTGGVYNHPILGIAIRWTTVGGQLQYINNPVASYGDPYSFTISYNHNSSGTADFKYISARSTLSGWRYFTASGNRDGEFDLASAGGKYEFTLIPDDETKPSFMGSLFHAGSTLKGIFKIEVIN
jgi:hypothetical protein